MKTFEERYTAWLDAKLSGAELESFEREIEDRVSAENDRSEVQKLGKLLRGVEQPILKNADFFNHQLMARIEADRVAAEPARSRSWSVLPWIRVALAGVAALVIGWMLGSTMNPEKRDTIATVDITGPGIASIISAQPLAPGISATVVQDDQEDVAVVWLDGLDYLPASYELQ